MRLCTLSSHTYMLYYVTLGDDHSVVLLASGRAVVVAL